MPKYRVTDKAGRYVGGFKNPSSGSIIEMSEEEARYELILGTIEAVSDEPPPEDPPAEQVSPVSAKPGKKKR